MSDFDWGAYIAGTLVIVFLFIILVLGYGTAMRSVTTDCQKHEMFFYADDLYTCVKGKK